MSAFASSGAALLLNAHRDSRPIFVFEKGKSRIGLRHDIDISFCNDAYRESSLAILLNGNQDDGRDFRRWVVSDGGDEYDLAEHHWTRNNVTVDSQDICIITGTPKFEMTASHNTNNDTDHHHANIKALRECIGQFVTPSLDAHLDLIESTDWTKAGLRLWPRELLELIRMVLILDAPLGMTLGDAGLLIYNESYATKIAGTRHPRILGISLEDAWPEGKSIRAESAPIIASQGFHNNELPVSISGELEKFCTWTMMRTSKELKSQFILSSDVTTSVLQERRRSAFAVLRDECANLDSFTTFCEKAGKICLADPHDVSFLQCFSVDETGPVLQTTFPSFESQNSTQSASIATTLKNAMESKSPIFLFAHDKTLPVEWQELACTHGFGKKAKMAVIGCLRSGDGAHDIFGIVVIGLNPKRPLDSLHRGFAESLIKELSTYGLSSLRRAAEIKSSASKNERLDNFTKLFEMTDVGLFEYGSDWKLTHANDAYHVLSGYPRDLSTQTSMTFIELIHPDDVEQAMVAWSKLAVESLPISFEFRWRWPDRELTDDEKELGGQWVIASCLPLFNDGRNHPDALSGAMGVMISGTETKRSILNLKKRAEALEAARDTEQRFKAFAEMAPAGIYILDNKRKLQYCNKTFMDMVGSPRSTRMEDFVYSDYILPEDLDSVAAAFATLLDDHQPVSHHFRVKRLWRSPDGIESEAYLSAASYPVLDEEGNITAIQGIMFDVSSFKWAERIQKARVEEAIEAKKQQERFIDMTSHELRNPLSAVVQCTEVVLDNMKQVLLHARQILRGTTSEAQEQYRMVEEEITTAVASLRTVEECTGHMRRIIDDVLSLSKLDAKLLTISPTTVRFEDAIRNCTNMFYSAARADNVQLEFDQDVSLKELDKCVSMDAGRVGQVLANLITNAIKFSRTEAVGQIRVRCGASRERPTVLDKVEFPRVIEEHPETNNEPDSIYLWTTVTDTGSGLSEAQRSLLFHRFSQAFAPRTHSKYGGSGLGLFISKSLCELQGGEIGVYSAGVGQGSTFAFYIKSTLVASAPEQPGSPIDNGIASLQIAVINPADISILVTEDNIVNSKVLVQQLKKRGFVVHVAYHGVEALNILRNSTQWKDNSSGHKIDIITMDVEMPVMGGLDCTRAIRKYEQEGDITCHIPIIAVSANARQEQMDETKAAGMDDSIAKPFRIKELLPKIQRLVQQARLNGIT